MKKNLNRKPRKKAKKRKLLYTVLYVAGVPFYVYLVNKFPKEPHKKTKNEKALDKNENVLAMSFDEDQVILLKKDMGNDIKNRTLFHEALHIYLRQFSYLFGAAGKEEESYVELLELFIWDFLNQNKKLFKKFNI
jgi:hypothetical protein